MAKEVPRTYTQPPPRVGARPQVICIRKQDLQPWWELTTSKLSLGLLRMLTRFKVQLPLQLFILLAQETAIFLATTRQPMPLRNLRLEERDSTLLNAHLLLTLDIKLSRPIIIIRQQTPAIWLFSMAQDLFPNKAVRRDLRLNISMLPSRNRMECQGQSQASTTTL